MANAKQLARTILLFQTDLGISDSAVVYRALTAPRILLMADQGVVNTLSGQTAISTAAMLMVRSGHKVLIDTPDAPLLGYQPPMSGRTFHEAISSVGGRLIDGVSITVGQPRLPPDITFVFGNCVAATGISSKRMVSVGWTDWAAELAPWPTQVSFSAGDWSIGAMGAAVLVASEAAKLVGLSLAKFTSLPSYFFELFKPCSYVYLSLAPAKTSQRSDLGEFDLISAGAVSNAFLYALLRLPSVSGHCRVFDKDISDDTNRNRNMLLLPDFVTLPKVDLFKNFENGILINPERRHLFEADVPHLTEQVAVGVDDIPTRWVLARRRSSWMGVGATSHFDSMASVHYPCAACAGCLHPTDERLTAPTPTIAFVSFLAGLMMAADFLANIAQSDMGTASYYRYVNALQLGNPWDSPVIPRGDCPAGCPASRLKVA